MRYMLCRQVRRNHCTSGTSDASDGRGAHDNAEDTVTRYTTFHSTTNKDSYPCAIPSAMVRLFGWPPLEEESKAKSQDTPKNEKMSASDADGLCQTDNQSDKSH